MNINFQTRAFYLGAFFVLCFICLLLRLYFLQIVETENHLATSESIRTRIALHFPPRAKIVDRKGKALAYNQASWDLALNLLEFNSPDFIIERAQRSPELYPDFEEIEEFHINQLIPLQEYSYPSPSRARAFFMQWDLRTHPIVQHDHEVLVQHLVQILELDEYEFRASLELVYNEVSALRNSFSDPLKAPSTTVFRAYAMAKQALTNSEYWERIRRYPKSLSFLPVLHERLEQSQHLLQLLEALHDSIDEYPEYYLDFLSKAHKQSEKQQKLLAAQISPEYSYLDQTLPQKQHAQATKNNEAFAIWEWLETRCAELLTIQSVDSLLEKLENFINVLEGEDIDQSSPALNWLKERSITGLHSRIKRLEEQIIAPYKQDYQNRWKNLFVSSEDGSSSFPPNPLKLAQRVSRQKVEIIKLYQDVFQGITCTAHSLRRYESNSFLDHFVGHVGLASQEKIENDIFKRPIIEESLSPLIERWFENDLKQFQRSFFHRFAQQKVGTQGLEAFYDERLSGEPGASVNYIDAHGRIRKTEEHYPSSSAETLELSLDLELQRNAMKIVNRYEPILQNKSLYGAQAKTWNHVGRSHWSLRGCFIMLDVKSGEILSILNFPTFDLEKFRGLGDEAEAYRDQILKGDDDLPQNFYWLKQAPLLNRAISGQYAPGSVFKLVSSLSLLESNTIDAGSKNASPQDPTSSANMKGKVYQGKGFRLRTGHPAGVSNVIQAITRSSNEFFWYFSEELPGKTPAKRYQQTLFPMAQAFGFGSLRSTDLFGEKRGSLPHPRSISAGELALLSIGQGKLLVTPLQIASFMATLASKGNFHAPHLALESNPENHSIKIAPEHWELLHLGMRGVVFDAHGTASKSKICQELKVAAKTGTAQNGRFRSSNGEFLEIPDHAWFAGFAPYDDPQVAFVALAEYSGLYGGDLADLSGEILQVYFDSQEKKESSHQSLTINK